MSFNPTRTDDQQVKDSEKLLGFKDLYPSFYTFVELSMPDFSTFIPDSTVIEWYDEPKDDSKSEEFFIN